MPAAPSLARTDPRSAEAAQRLGAGLPDWLVVEGGRSGPVPGCGVPVGVELTGGVVAGDWDAGEGWVEVETARQEPVAATAVAKAMATMILAGRMVIPSIKHGSM